MRTVEDGIRDIKEKAIRTKIVFGSHGVGTFLSVCYQDGEEQKRIRFRIDGNQIRYERLPWVMIPGT